MRDRVGCFPLGRPRTRWGTGPVGFEPKRSAGGNTARIPRAAQRPDGRVQISTKWEGAGERAGGHRQDRLTGDEGGE